MKHFFPTLALACFGMQAHAAIKVKEPTAEKATLSVRSPDVDVKTLGKVSIVIDLSAQHDTLFELQTRRAGLKLADGRKSSVFGYDQQGGVVVVSVAPVTRISVTGVSGKNVLAIFYDANNNIIAPAKSDVRIFDLNYKPLGFSYEPAQPPGAITMDVSILIDRSGSMFLMMNVVRQIMRSFVQGLPDFTRCSIYTFADTVETLADGSIPCPNTAHTLDAPLTVGGGTALYGALEQALSAPNRGTPGMPHLVIVVTDGVNNGFSVTREQIAALKVAGNTRVLVFWAGAYEPEHLQGIADHEMVATADLQAELDAFFTSIGISVSGMQTLVLQ